jgi:serine/threonine protein kinase
MPLDQGAQIGPYRILAPLGAGGMGEVYRAHDPRLGRDVAIKVLSARSAAAPEARARFGREARAISQLSHPHICSLFDVGRQGDTDYLVMELLEGETLAQRLERGALALPQVLSIGAQIAHALGHAHRAGVVHRDLKPSNVMLTESGAKLMDFGLARSAVPGPPGAASELSTMTPPLTSEGVILGTFQYMSPEQIEGKVADSRSDVWAMGCVLYEMTTGRRAFEGTSRAGLIATILKEEPRPISELQPLTPASLHQLVGRCLAKDPDARFQSASDLGFALSTLGGASGSGPLSNEADRRGTRHRALGVGVAIF